MRLVAVSTSTFGRHDSEPLEQLRASGFEVSLNPYGRKLSASEVVELAGTAEGLVAGTEPLDREVLEQCTRLRAISRCGVGIDNVDLAGAEELGIAVACTESAHVDAVAELALAGILDLLRHVSTADRNLRAGHWSKPMGRLLRGRTVGIVGLGRTGRRLAELLAPFEVSLLASEPRPDLTFAEAHGIELVALDRLLGESDIVTLHADIDMGSRHLIGPRELETMRSDGLLVNCARGSLIDEAALVAALGNNRLSGVYLDVFEDEPYSGPLTGFDRVLVTPHIGSYAVEGRVAMELEAVDNLIRLLERSS